MRTCTILLIFLFLRSEPARSQEAPPELSDLSAQSITFQLNAAFDGNYVLWYEQPVAANRSLMFRCGFRYPSGRFSRFLTNRQQQAHGLLTGIGYMWYKKYSNKAYLYQGVSLNANFLVFPLDWYKANRGESGGLAYTMYYLEKGTYHMYTAYYRVGFEYRFNWFNIELHGGLGPRYIRKRGIAYHRSSGTYIPDLEEPTIYKSHVLLLSPDLVVTMGVLLNRKVTE